MNLLLFFILCYVHLFGFVCIYFQTTLIVGRWENFNVIIYGVPHKQINSITISNCSACTLYV